MYSSTLSLTSALDGGGWLTPRPGRFNPGKEIRYPLFRRLGGPQGRSGRVREISSLPEFDPRIVQPVAQSLYRLSYSGSHTSESTNVQEQNEYRGETAVLVPYTVMTGNVPDWHIS